MTVAGLVVAGLALVVVLVGTLHGEALGDVSLRQWVRLSVYLVVVFGLVELLVTGLLHLPPWVLLVVGLVLLGLASPYGRYLMVVVRARRAKARGSVS